MKKRILAIALLAAGFHTAFAMSVRDAGENLLYFEHAKLSAEHCEKQGVSVRAAFTDWQQKHIPVYRQASDTIRAEAAKGGLSKPEQEGVLAAAIESQRKLALDNISRKGVACQKFGAVLQMYTDLLKR
jgi:hypothetical protein